MNLNFYKWSNTSTTLDSDITNKKNSKRLPFSTAHVKTETDLMVLGTGHVLGSLV